MAMSSRCFGYKIMFQNLPLGTMKSDVTDALFNWDLNVTVLCVDLAPPKNAKLRQKTVNAYVALASRAECESVIDFYNLNFAMHGGFAFQNSSSKFKMVTVTRYVKRKTSTESLADGAMNNQRFPTSADTGIRNTGFTEHSVDNSNISAPTPTTIMNSVAPCGSQPEDFNKNNIKATTRDIGTDDDLYHSRFVNDLQEISATKTTATKTTATAAATTTKTPTTTIASTATISPQDQLLLEELSKEKENFERENDSISQYIQLLEQTLKENCTEFFISDADIRKIEQDTTNVSSEIVEQRELLESSKLESKELKYDFENYQ